MSRHNPLLVVSSIHPAGYHKTLQLPHQQQHIEMGMPKKSRKFVIKSLHNQIKLRTLNLEQNIQLPASAISSRVKPESKKLSINLDGSNPHKKASISIQRNLDNSVELFIGTLTKQFRQTRSVSRDKNFMRKYAYHVKKQENSDFIRKSLLEPCQITTATFSERNQNTLYNKFNARQYSIKNRFSNFSIKRKNKNISKFFPETLEPWGSQRLQIEQQNF